MESGKTDRRKFLNHLSDSKKNSVEKIARDSLAIETLGELAVYSAALPYKSFVAVTLAKIMSLMGAATGSVFNYDPKTKSASIILWQGMEAEDVEDFSRQGVPPTRREEEETDGFPGLAANCILKKSPILVEEPLANRYLATDYFRRIIEKYNLSSAIAMPLIKEAHVYGAIVLFTAGRKGDADNKFDEDDVKFLSAVSLPVVSAFEAQRHVEELRAEQSKLWKIMENLSIGVIFTDGKGTIKNINKTALGMLKMEEGMAIEKPIGKILLENLSDSNDNPELLPRDFSDIKYDSVREVLYLPPPGMTTKASMCAPDLWNIKFIKLSDDNSAVLFSRSPRAAQANLLPQCNLAESTLKYIKKPLMDIMNDVNIAAISGSLNSRQFECLTRAQKKIENLWNNLSLMEKSVGYMSGRIEKPVREIFKPSEVIDEAIARLQHDEDEPLPRIIRYPNLSGDEKTFYGNKKGIEDILVVILREISRSRLHDNDEKEKGVTRSQTTLLIKPDLTGERIKFDIYSDKPAAPGGEILKSEATAQYLRCFFDYLKGEIDFTPEMQPFKKYDDEKAAMAGIMPEEAATSRTTTTAESEKTHPVSDDVSRPRMYKVVSFSIPACL